jgi:hypothetical protein
MVTLIFQNVNQIFDSVVTISVKRNGLLATTFACDFKQLTKRPTRIAKMPKSLCFGCDVFLIRGHNMNDSVIEHFVHVIIAIRAILQKTKFKQPP